MIRLRRAEKEDMRHVADAEDVGLSVVARRALRAGWKALHGRPLGGAEKKRRNAG